MCKSSRKKSNCRHSEELEEEDKEDKMVTRGRGECERDFLDSDNGRNGKH
jgi:hypothetical protein